MMMNQPTPIRYRVPVSPLRPWPEVRALIAIGAPLVVNNLCTLALQTIDTVMAGRLGAAELAAVALGGNLWIPPFLFAMGVLMAVSPLAAFHVGAREPEAVGHIARQAAWLAVFVSLAMTVRIGHALGAGEGARVRSIGTLGYALCLAFALASAALMLAFPASIVRFYTDDPAVLPIAVGLIGMAAVFQVSDGLQVAALGALRGLRDTRGPMLINAAAYWGIGFPCAWIFGIALRHGPLAVWAGLVLGLTLAAVLLLGRFYRLTRAR